MRALEALAHLGSQTDAAHRDLTVGEGLVVSVLELRMLS